MTSQASKLILGEPISTNDPLQASRNAWGKSKLKKHLSKEILNKLKRKKTPTFGSTLKDVIQSGLENIDSGIGIYAPDAEAYTVFADLFDPIIGKSFGIQTLFS